MTTGGYTLEPVQVTDLKAVTEDVVYRAPGKNELEIRKAVCEAAREFLRRTGVWKETRRCAHVQDSWFGFRHGYLHAMVLRVDSFMEGICLQRMEGTPGDGVAPIPCGIPMPRIGNVYAPSIANFIEQGGYVLVAAPGYGLPPAIPDPYQQEDCTIAPVMAGSCQGSEGTVVFTLGHGGLYVGAGLHGRVDPLRHRAAVRGGNRGRGGASASHGADRGAYSLWGQVHERLRHLGDEDVKRRAHGGDDWNDFRRIGGGVIWHLWQHH